CRKIVASGFDEAQFSVRKLSVHGFDRGKVHGGIFANRRMRTASCLDTHDALCRQGLRRRGDDVGLLWEDAIGDHVNVEMIPKSLAQRLDQGCLARTNRATNSDT